MNIQATGKLKKIGFAVVILLGVFVVFSFGFYHWLISPTNGNNPPREIKVVIPKGASVVKIADILYQDGLVRHPLVFRLTVKMANLGNKMQAGTFNLLTSFNPRQIAQTLTEGTEDTWVRILEGWRAEEIADYLETQDLTNFDKAEFLTLTATQEGRLYPDTYLVPKEISSSEVVALLENTQQKKITQELMAKIESSEFSYSEVLVLASLIEREARGSEQMRRVAGILQNRLEINMPLQVDASLQYARGLDSQKQTWWAPPLASDKSINSPYNTYLHTGLPPTPICNPSLVAIESVLDPIASDDLFYLHALDGSMHYARTLEEHNANVNRYLR